MRVLLVAWIRGCHERSSCGGYIHGGDEGLRDSLYRMQADNAIEIRQQHGGPSREQMEFINRANAARS